MLALHVTFAWVERAAGIPNRFRLAGCSFDTKGVAPAGLAEAVHEGSHEQAEGGPLDGMDQDPSRAGLPREAVAEVPRQEGGGDD